jgi:benzoyl-CoA 2,3-dioxygenase component B
MVRPGTSIESFSDWVDLFGKWREDIGYDGELLGFFDLDAKYGQVEREIEFGDFAGQNRWERVIQIPDQRIRDALLTLIVFQGDTEFASVEQQKNLMASAPSHYDLQSLIRVNAEEMRHGWQMCHILVEHFGEQGKREAQKLLERRAWNRERLLGSFNEDIDNWVDFFIFTNFIDRDGKFQLDMLSTSSFQPLAASMGPMLKEERFHMATGNNGMKRVVKAGRIDRDVFQRYINKWLSTAFDLFGNDHSSSATWGYVWGLKGRFGEREATKAGERLQKEALNERARLLYYEEVSSLIAGLNEDIPEDWEPLYMPDIRFHRGIGDYAGKCYGVKGEELSAEAYRRHCEELLPGEKDKQYLRDLMKEDGWLAPPPKDKLF